MSNKENDNLDELLDELDDDETEEEPKDLDYRQYWTTFRMRTTSRDYIEALGKLMPINRNGFSEPRPMNQVLEYLLEHAGKRLLHRDMGAGFTHTPDPWCGCGPSWPPDKQYVVKKPD